MQINIISHTMLLIYCINVLLSLVLLFFYFTILKDSYCLQVLSRAGFREQWPELAELPGSSAAAD